MLYAVDICKNIRDDANGTSLVVHDQGQLFLELSRNNITQLILDEELPGYLRTDIMLVSIQNKYPDMTIKMYSELLREQEELTKEHNDEAEQTEVAVVDKEKSRRARLIAAYAIMFPMVYMSVFYILTLGRPDQDIILKYAIVSMAIPCAVCILPSLMDGVKKYLVIYIKSIKVGLGRA